MLTLYPTNWGDYQLIDSGNGQKLERFGKYILVRPDSQIIWKPNLSPIEWNKADAKFIRTSEDRGKWELKTKLPERWLIKYQDLSFWVKLSPFKHTGVFPEQAVHWDFINTVILNVVKDPLRMQDSNKLRDSSPSAQNDNQPNILNLFGYTGISSLVAAKAGAQVTHVDASYPTIGWARENQQASGLEAKPIRWILDDAIKFCEREVRRKSQYDGIIMDPPSFGHGPKGETWKFNESFPKLMEVCKQLISDNPLFIIVNAYAISTSAITLENVLRDFTKSLGGKIESGELVLKESSSNRLLSTGIFARWCK